jgi:type I restriction enzyme R subunit
MPSQTNESAIEKRLTRTCLAELLQQCYAGDVTERAELYHGGNGYHIDKPLDFSAKFALD